MVKLDFYTLSMFICGELRKIFCWLQKHKTVKISTAYAKQTVLTVDLCQSVCISMEYTGITFSQTFFLIKIWVFHIFFFSPKCHMVKHI